MLREAGELGADEGTFDDLTGALELALGRLVKDKHGVDFFILDRFPSAIRPFYTMPCPDDARYSNSYDLFLRGQEICSGASAATSPSSSSASSLRRALTRRRSMRTSARSATARRRTAGSASASNASCSSTSASTTCGRRPCSRATPSAAAREPSTLDNGAQYPRAARRHARGLYKCQGVRTANGRRAEVGGLVGREGAWKGI